MQLVRVLAGPLAVLALVILAYSSLRVECAVGGGAAVRGRARTSVANGAPARAPAAHAPPWLRPCRGFSALHESGGCDLKQLNALCVPLESYVWHAARGPTDDGGCASGLDGGERVCGSDVAVVLMTSRNTASRVAPSLATWVSAGRALGMSVMIAVASQEGAAAVRASAPLIPVEVLGVPEHSNHGGYTHVQHALRRLWSTHPGRRWYMKMDDDAFLYPSNLLHVLARTGANASALQAFGNTLTQGGHFVSGGAGYVLSAAALSALLAREHACFNESQWPAATNEDIVVSACLDGLGAAFMHGHGFYMSPPDQAFTSWRQHHWTGEARFPVTFHWLSSAHTKACLACGCVEVADGG